VKDARAPCSSAPDRIGTLAGENLEADTAFSEVLGCINHMFEVASQAIELPDAESAALKMPRRVHALMQHAQDENTGICQLVIDGMAFTR
jgi:hypothetical protein